QQIDVPSELAARALGEGGFQNFLQERGPAEAYRLSANQAEAIVAMQLGSLANLERENLQGEHRKLLESITDYLRLLSDEANIRAVIRQDLEELKQKYGDERRTSISEEEIVEVDRGDLIAEEPMVVTLSQRGYVKRTPLSIYQAQNRGGKGITGARADEEDPLKHVFVASTHDWLLFFTDRGKVYWRKVYDLPLQSRTSKGRAIVNLLSLQDETEGVSNCIAVREFNAERYLLMVTKGGLVKKTALSAYSRPMRGGIIAIRLDEGDELIDVRIVSPGDDVVLGTNRGMSIRFDQDDARAMGRATRGVKGISLSQGDKVVGMAIADESMTLLTVCENGYGKRTPFGPGELQPGETEEEDDAATLADAALADEGSAAEAEENGSRYTSSSMRYRRQRRGGKGLRDIRTTPRNGPVIDVLAVADEDEILMVTAGGKIQRIRAGDISQIGRNTQGVRIIRLDEGDKLVSVARIPGEVAEDVEDETPAVDSAETDTEPSDSP
ncbi:MAG: DNA gyrase C-terminal beta-propeller domain-containing protein, partial [Planctomycetaceae bacterium]